MLLFALFCLDNNITFRENPPQKTSRVRKKKKQPKLKFHILCHDLLC